jgi:hypothetical protein
LFPFRVGEACNIEDYEEYRVLIRNMLKTKPRKPVSIIVELTQIQKHCKVSDVFLSLPEMTFITYHYPEKSKTQ